MIGVSDYELKLKKNFVLARPEARQRKIAGEIHELTRKHKVQLHDDAGLQNLVVYLNEYPSVIVGGFDKKYLRLPDEILTTVMRDHQKYFGLESKDGELVPQFLAVINLPGDAKGIVRAGARARAPVHSSGFCPLARWPSCRDRPHGNDRRS